MRRISGSVAACLLLATTVAVAADDWSWGPDTSSGASVSGRAQPDASEVTLRPSSPLVASNQVPPADRHPRLLGLHNVLCSMGIGISCIKRAPPLNFHSSPTIRVPGHQTRHPSLLPHVPLTVVEDHYSLTHVHHGQGVVGETANYPGLISGGFQHPSPGQVPHLLSRYQNCKCVHASYCASYDVVARRNTGQDGDLIDARSRSSDILSNATDKENITTTAALIAVTTPSSGRQERVLSFANTGNETRVRRDTPYHADVPSNSTLHAEGRALFNNPGLYGCGAAYVCCRSPKVPTPPRRYTCGRRHSSGAVPRIKTPQYVKGDTEFGEYPWHVAILQRHDEYVCGGVLIDERHVLTAAHCVDGVTPHYLKVRLGEWDVHGHTEFYDHVEMRTEFVVVHPDYYAGNLGNDIAIIRMHRYLDFSSNPHISPVCLPDAYSSFVGQRCYSTGWGKDAFGSNGKYQSVLQEVELPVVDYHQCQEALRHTRLGRRFTLHQGMLCAGGEEGRDTCKGDGGGPLVCPGPGGRSQLAGLVSWGVECGLSGLPGIYVDVAHYTRWIRTIISAP